MSGKAVNYATVTQTVRTMTTAGIVNRIFMVTCRSLDHNFPPEVVQIVRERLNAYATTARGVHASIILPEFLTAMGALNTPDLFGVAIDDGETVFRIDVEAQGIG